MADEVRKLAERTTKATKEISETIKSVQKETKEADLSMVQAGKTVSDGMKLIQEVERVLDNIFAASNSLTEMILKITESSQEESNSAIIINRNIDIINTVTHESTSGIQQIANASEDLSRLTNNLHQLISRFKIDDSDK